MQAVGISTGDPRPYLQQFIERNDITFPLVLADPLLPNPYYEELIATWELDPVYPTFVLLDGQGVIRYRATGVEGKDLYDALDLIEVLLQETAAEDA